ncbi:MAG TPA: ATP-dependent Clp protease ATP-binding subunit [Myxococcota bacterium]|nr:ATP-dependent Clp protease ATP-binding subunit [Myxococcota bacterium]HNZ03148.1 ATP-dependent Clp protease ATP-binding subunit [Myxococcota bacterium]HOH77128.1 ATP-dependent Clp protease ATP-binding subunit [Myxococcota bacterium]
MNQFLVELQVSEQILFTQEVKRIYENAAEISAAAGKPLDTSTLLLAMFAVPCTAQAILAENRIDDIRLMNLLSKIPADGDSVLGPVCSNALRIAANIGSPAATSVHLLLAILSAPSCRGARVILATGIPLLTLRSQSLAHLMDPAMKQAATSKVLTSIKSREDSFGPSSWAAMPQSAGVTQPVAPSQTVQAIGKGRTASEPIAPDCPDDDEPIVFDCDRDFSVLEMLQDDGGDEVVEDIGPAADADADDDNPATESAGHGSFRLDPARFPVLAAWGRNLTAEAASGRLDQLIGRDRELTQVIDILSKCQSNNPLLIGEPGVGKTALVEGLAWMIANRPQGVPGIADKIIISITTADLVSGTSMRGEFAQRLRSLKKEVAASNGRVILFIDEIHTIIGAGAGDGGSDAANDLKGELARGMLPCIGATTIDEYNRHIKKDSALDRRFDKVILAEPNLAEAERILMGIAPKYERYHKVRFTEEAIRAAVRLTDRVMPNQTLPSKAINLMDITGARVRRDGRTLVERDDIVHVLAAVSNLPGDFLDMSLATREQNLKDRLKSRVFGCDSAIDAISSSVARNWARFGTRKPVGSFIFAGAPGTGKSTLARELADAIFGNPDAFLLVPMADYSESHTLSNLIGAPAGFVGYEEGGLLSDTLLRTPFLVIVWQNAHLADPSVLAQVVNIVRNGSITNRLGRRLDFRNSVQIITCESPDACGGSSRGVGFGRDRYADDGTRIEAGIKKLLPPDLVREVDGTLAFQEPDEPTRRKVTAKVLERALSEFLDANKVAIMATPEAIDTISELWNASRETGIDGVIASAVLKPAADMVKLGRVPSGASMTVEPAGDGQVRLRL